MAAVDGYLVIDEAYGEFAPDYQRPTGAHVIIVRTLSKIYGLAGLRIGIAIAEEATFEQLTRFNHPYPVNSVSLNLANELFSDDDHLNDFIAYQQQSKQRLEAALKTVDKWLTIVPSKSNFIFTYGERAPELAAFLLERGYQARQYDEALLKQAVRYSIIALEDYDGFEQALREKGLSFICEVKRASPSKGLIAEDFPYRTIAKDYEEAGATAISVLTEPDFFQGHDAYLTEISRSVSIPILRKDFIIDPYQIYQAKAIGADAILLICAILTNEQLTDYITLATELGLSVLTEAHNQEEVQAAVAAGSRIVGVNNRQLHDFSVDFQNSISLRQHAPADIIFVAESGIQTAADIDVLRANKVDAVLIGETIMRADDKKAKIRELRGD